MTSGDYDDLFDWTEEDVAPFGEKTEVFMKHVYELITLKE